MTKFPKEGYWWQNAIYKFSIKGKAILHCGSTGCQAMNDFKWAGKVTGFEKGTMMSKPCEFIVIEILIHNSAYGDQRDHLEPEIYKYPLINADIQYVKGIWVLFT